MHARRRFADALKGLAHKDKVKGWVSAKAIKIYKELYKIERLACEYSPEARHEYRQAHAVPLWEAFVKWARQMQGEGVAHASSREALKYFLKHIDGLRRYCDDGRLPISNIQAGARSTAMNYCLIETAKANGHNAYQYLSVEER